MVSLCEAFPRLGTPTDALRHYKIFPDILQIMDKHDEYLMDITALAEHNRRKNEEYERQKEEREEEKEHLGMTRYKKESEFWDEVERANSSP